MGRAGLAAACALCDLAGPESVRGCDLHAPPAAVAAREALGKRGASIVLNSDGLAALASQPAPACVVKSPGVPFDAPVLVRAAKLGLPVIDELELAWRIGLSPLIWVTGTSGKSTVCSLLAAIADSAELPAQVCGNTEFGAPLSALAMSGAEGLICETSSYQLEGCPDLLPQAALLTNLRPDHLARHPTMEAYADLKRRLFVRGTRSVELAVLSADDALGRVLTGEVSDRGGRVLRFGRAAEAEYRLLDCGWTLRSGWVEAETPDGRLRLETRLPGAHNAENALAALAAARGLGFELEAALSSIARAEGVPGRFELIDEGQPFDVIVDFAHTPDAMEAVLGATRRIAEGRRGARVHVVLGDAGHRPKMLRVPLGAAAGGLADRVIVTEGNLRGEPLEASVAPLNEGARSAGRAAVELVLGRREAFRHAFATAAEHDLVVLVGRGARATMTKTVARDQPIPFDDRIVAREELRALLGGPDPNGGQSRVATMRA